MYNYTKEEQNQMRQEAWNELVEHAGSVAHLARMLGIHIGTAINWDRKGYITEKGMEILEQHPVLSEKFTRERLRA